MLTPSQKRSIFNGFTAFFGGFDSRIPLHEPLRNLRPQRPALLILVGYMALICLLFSARDQRRAREIAAV